MHAHVLPLLFCRIMVKLMQCTDAHLDVARHRLLRTGVGTAPDDDGGGQTYEWCAASLPRRAVGALYIAAQSS